MGNRYFFPKSYRLTEAAQFKNLHKKRKKAFSKGEFFIQVMVNNQTHARLGIVIGKRNVKHAWARNKLRRAIKESFRCWQHDIANYDVVLIAKKSIKPAIANFGLAVFVAQELRPGLVKVWQELNRSG